MNSPVSYDLKDQIACITLDDGKVNAMSFTMMGHINEALDKAEKEAAVVILAGRPGIFSAGFDLKEMGTGPEALCNVVKSGAELVVRLLSYPLPTVAACTGHAYPMGTFILMSCDYRIGISGNFNLGLNEVRIGMTLPKFAMLLASYRLSPPLFNRTALTGELFSPGVAAQAGFLDRVVDVVDLTEAVRAKAEDFLNINPLPYRNTKAKARKDLLAAMKAAIAEEQTVERARESLAQRAS